MIPARRSHAIVEAKRRRENAIRTASRADKRRLREKSPAAKEDFVAACREVVLADDRLERLGVARA